MTGKDLYQQRTLSTVWEALSSGEKAKYDGLATTATRMGISVAKAAEVLWSGGSLLGPGAVK
jgi:hypothetical protein